MDDGPGGSGSDGVSEPPEMEGLAPAGTWGQTLIAWISKDWSNLPTYHLLLETFLLCCLGLLLFGRRATRSSNSGKVKLTKEEEEELLAEWVPEPLVPDVDPDDPMLRSPIVSGKPGKFITVDGRRCLDMGTHNYLGFAGDESIEAAAIETVKKFGVGSCGPRGFYGTADVHIYTEERIAKFLGTEQASMYSYGFSTMSSAIPAFAKRGDIIFADERVNFAIQKGLDASRSRVKFFAHNDVKHLIHLLEEQAVEDKKKPKQAKVSRRFLVVEGIYLNTGRMCPLREMMELKEKFKLRLFIDESISFGTLGSSGKGITEHLDVPIREVDMIMASLEFGIGSVGGFVAGPAHIVEHQSLNGLGYCFSASLPPLLATATMEALNKLEKDASRVAKLQDNCRHAQSCFSKVNFLQLHGHPQSPLKHLCLTDLVRAQLEDCGLSEKALMGTITEQAREEGLAITVAAYLEDQEVRRPNVSIRLTVSSLLDQTDIEEAAQKLSRITKRIFKPLYEGEAS